MADKNMKAKITVDFEENPIRESLNSGETVNTLFGKIKKFFTDLKAVAFSGSYNDLSDKPLSLPANGGNADTVDGKHANEITSNPNLLINPNFRINQRNATGWVVDENFPNAKIYMMDRWKIISGTATWLEDSVSLDGTLIQVLENPVGANVIASCDASGDIVASYDDSTRTFTLSGNGMIRWAKLEYGDTATPFIPPDPALELIKCQRYYEAILVGNDSDRDIPVIPYGAGYYVDFRYAVPKYSTLERPIPTFITNQVRLVLGANGGLLSVEYIKPLMDSTKISKYGVTVVIPLDKPELTSIATTSSIDALGITPGVPVIAVDAEIY